MKAIKAFGPEDLRVVEVADPQPGANEVLIEIKASGICGSDKWLWQVDGPVDSIAGHEVAGLVVKTGSQVNYLQEGDRVAVNNVVGCGVCEQCRAGRFVRCPARPGNDVNGGFAELVTAPEANCLLLADEISYDAGALIFDNWGTPYAALEKADVKNGDDVIISGCGPIGLCAISLARQRGAYVIAVDPVEYRLQAALKAGARQSIIPDNDLPEKVRSLTGGRGVNKVIECSGNGQAYDNCLEALAVEGTMVAVGEEAKYMLEPSRFLIRKNLNLIGSWYTTMQQGKEVQQLIVDGKIAPEEFVTHRVSLQEVPGLFSDIMALKEGFLKVLIIDN